MQDIEITSNNEEETAEFAAEISNNCTPNDVFTLNGTLGAGKTSFSRNFIKNLCGSETEVPSPTFTLLQTYDSPKGEIWHFDLYRLEDPEEIYELGWEEALGHHIMLIEWPERLGPLLPKHRKEIDFDIVDNNTRQIKLKDTYSHE